jgi:hypothetical protein
MEHTTHACQTTTRRTQGGTVPCRPSAPRGLPHSAHSPFGRSHVYTAQFYTFYTHTRNAIAIRLVRLHASHVHDLDVVDVAVGDGLVHLLVLADARLEVRQRLQAAWRAECTCKYTQGKDSRTCFRPGGAACVALCLGWPVAELSFLRAHIRSLLPWLLRTRGDARCALARAVRVAWCSPSLVDALEVQVQACNDPITCWMLTPL